MNYFDEIKGIAQGDGMPPALATLIAAQAAHETSNFTSKVFIEDLNCFGYKRFPGAKYQLASGRMSPEGNNYARYATIADSVHEITAWIKRRLKEGRFPPLDEIVTAADYAVNLKKCGYYGDTSINYLTGLDRALKRYAGGDYA